MPTLRSVTAPAAPAPTAVAIVPESILERGTSQHPSERARRRTRPTAIPAAAVLELDDSRFGSRYLRLVDLALVLACMSIFLGVLAVALVG